jgi:hypothetical protein
MNPADKIERAIEQLHITTRAETDKSILDDAFAALEKSAQKQSPQAGFSARRKILRIRIAELAAVAAVILVIFALFFGTPVAEGVTFGQIIQAVGQVRNVCVSRFVPHKVEPTQQVWSSLTMNIKLFKGKREGQMEYVLWDLPNRRKMSVFSGSVDTNDVSADLLAQTEKSMISDLGIVPFKDTKNLPEGAQWNLVEDPNVLAIVPGTEVYDLTWSETGTRGVYTRYRKWRVFVDTSTNLPKRTESYRKKTRDMEYEFYRFIIITYPSEEQIRTIIHNEFGPAALQPRAPGYRGTPPPN